jgi:hypothetical protein
MGTNNDSRGLGVINAEIEILNAEREIMESEDWDDKTHLERKYKMHLNNFDGVVRYLCNAVGLQRIKDINENGYFGVKDQNGEKVNFDISRDFNKTRGEGKLVSYVVFNEKTKASSLLHYSPTMGIGFEYVTDLLPQNVRLGKGDFFGKTIENMVKNIASATDDVKFYTRFERYEKDPKGIKKLVISTEDFVKDKEKQGDIMSIIAFLDSIARGIRQPAPWVYGSNFIHEKEGPLFNISMKFNVNDWFTRQKI